MMHQQGRRPPHFGPTWPEVTGLGHGPNKRKKHSFFAGVSTPALLAESRTREVKALIARSYIRFAEGYKYCYTYISGVEEVHTFIGEFFEPIAFS